MKQVLLVIRMSAAGNFLAIPMTESDATQIIDQWCKGLLKDGFLHDRQFPKPGWAVRVSDIQLMHVQDPSQVQQQQQQGNMPWYGKSGMN